jgi:hypothetical protein
MIAENRCAKFIISRINLTDCFVPRNDKIETFLSPPKSPNSRHKNPNSSEFNSFPLLHPLILKQQKAISFRQSAMSHTNFECDMLTAESRLPIAKFKQQKNHEKVTLNHRSFYCRKYYKSY